MATYFGDLQHTAVIGQSIIPGAAVTASANGLGVDMILGDANNFNVLLTSGVYDVTSSNETYVVNITESDDNITFVPLATPVSFSLTAAGGASGLAVPMAAWGMRSKRYLRAELVIGGTTPSITGLTAIFIERLKISGVGGGNYSA
jgi:hypothetical protein